MSQPPHAIMIFAAGFGARMGALTKNVPKPLIEVAGKPLIDHALDIAQAVQPEGIVANLHYRADQLAEHLIPLGVLTTHEHQILETGGGLRAALPLLGNDPVFTMNPDVIWQGANPLELLKNAWRPDQMDALLMCVPLAQSVGRVGTGDFDADGAGRLRRGSQLVYGGVQIIKTDRLAEIRESVFSLNVLWDQMAAKNRLYCCQYPGKWCDVGRPEGIALAETLLAQPNV